MTMTAVSVAGGLALIVGLVLALQGRELSETVIAITAAAIAGALVGLVYEIAVRVVGWMTLTRLVAITALIATVAVLVRATEDMGDSER